MAVGDDPNSVFIIDDSYEFSAPRFFDFTNGESSDEMRRAELWFENAPSHAPSPFMPRIKAGRSVQLESQCDFSENEKLEKMQESESSEKNTLIATKESTLRLEQKQTRQAEIMPSEIREEVTPNEPKAPESSGKNMPKGEALCTQEIGSAAASSLRIVPSTKVKTSAAKGKEDCRTPLPQNNSQKANSQQTGSKKIQTARKIAAMVQNPSTQKSKTQPQSKSTANLASVRRDKASKDAIMTPNFSQENQAIKRRKLDGGNTSQILNIKPHILPHKTRSGICSNSNLFSSISKTIKEDRKLYVREQTAAPFVSVAEMMKKFQSNTRDLSLPCLSSSLSHSDAASVIQKKPKLTLTRPREPKFETAQRIRPVKVKSSAEIEEEIMAKIPKFKARPINKKILEAPTLPALPRSTPNLPEFQEFHLETMARANQNAEISTIASTESAHQNLQWKPHLTAPKSPCLHTSMRARPPSVKSSDELEKEELEKIPKFKARPLNKKIFESNGALGIFCNTKRQITIPQEFHFAIDERIPLPPPATVANLFDKLSLDSEPQKQHIRNTVPDPFHLHTEERGTEKERKFFMELFQEQLEEEQARIPKANPYPYTTDYPVIPPKPEPKYCTKPEPFQLESLVRHEEEVRKEMEERKRIDMEEARMKIFKAQPIVKEDPIPVPEKQRKPLTQVQEFNLHVVHRAVDRAEFDKKVKEKEISYKRYREEAESAKMMEEEKALKHLRKTLVPHARRVPNFSNPFLPQKSCKEVTKPKSPKLHIVRRKERRIPPPVCAVAATSSAAAYKMR